ncbi:MAG: OmpH family outer membrane protein [Gemmatimonadales bacterium]|jgi:Skp family chaperone for outer membrane proteins
MNTYVGFAALVGLAAVTIAAIPGAQQGPPAYAYVSSEIILRQTPGFASAESTWNAEVASMREDIEAMSRQLDSAVRAFDQQSIVLSPTARQEKQDELRTLNEQLQERGNAAQLRADQRQRELMAPLEERIQAVIDGLRAERGLGVIFDVSAPGNNIVSADPVLDLTSTVVRRLTGGSE